VLKQIQFTGSKNVMASRRLALTLRIGLKVLDENRASTSHVERKNATLRQWCKRLTRLTYAFSKSWANLKAALALHFWHYNFCRVHSALRITPAMAAGITDHVWTFTDLIA
jgi:hypothetical protein